MARRLEFLGFDVWHGSCPVDGFQPSTRQLLRDLPHETGENAALRWTCDRHPADRRRRTVPHWDLFGDWAGAVDLSVGTLDGQVKPAAIA